MSDRDRDRDPVPFRDEDLIEVSDSGDSLEAALGEQETSAIVAAEEKL